MKMSCNRTNTMHTLQHLKSQENEIVGIAEDSGFIQDKNVRPTNQLVVFAAE